MAIGDRTTFICNHRQYTMNLRPTYYGVANVCTNSGALQEYLVLEHVGCSNPAACDIKMGYVFGFAMTLPPFSFKLPLFSFRCCCCDVINNNPVPASLFPRLRKIQTVKHTEVQRASHHDSQKWVSMRQKAASSTSMEFGFRPCGLSYYASQPRHSRIECSSTRLHRGAPYNLDSFFLFPSET